MLPREDKRVRELIPHIGPIPILIRLRLFLEGNEFPRIMLPRALRGSFVEEKSINMAGIVECEMRIALFIYLFIFNFYMDQSASRKRNGQRFNHGSKTEQKKFNFIFWR